MGGVTLFGLGFKKTVCGKVFIITQDTRKKKSLPKGSNWREFNEGTTYRGMD